MAVAEHEITQQETTQIITVRLTEAQAAKLRQAAAASGRSMEEFVVSASVRAVDAPDEIPALPPTKSFASVLGIFKDSPELDALMEHIHEQQRLGIEQFRAEEAAAKAQE